MGSISPLYQNSFIKNAEYDESLYISSAENSMPETSSTDTRKQLIEFFRESFNGDVDNNQNLQDMTETKPMAFYLSSKCINISPYESVNSFICSNGTTPGGYPIHTKEKTAHSACLPNLMRSLSFRERKKRLSPAYSGTH